jgi:hypothetical protein
MLGGFAGCFACILEEEHHFHGGIRQTSVFGAPCAFLLAFSAYFFLR